MMTLMLPAWATVVIALGSAAIGAATALLAPVLATKAEKRKLTHEENEAWRATLIQACQGLSESWLEVRWALHSAVEGVSVFDDEAATRLVPLGTRCAQMVAKARLVFGQGKPAGAAANDVDDSVARLKDEALQADKPWDEPTRKKIGGLIRTAEEAHAGFLRAANRAIEPRSWSQNVERSV
jgi:hypothetical protein